MKMRYAQVACWICFGLLCLSPSTLMAGNLADVICYWEMGTNPASGIPWWDPTSVLTESGGLAPGLSLGNWTDSTSAPPTSMTGGYNANQGNPAGLVVGFTTPVYNGVGNDLKIMGNAMAIDGSEYYFSEPGYIEVAMETTSGQTGATADGWADETFYLIKPSNYDIVGDPRDGVLSGIYTYGDDPSGAVDEYGDPIQVQIYNGSWGEDLIAAGGSQLELYGYADWNPSGDRVNIDDAIDADGNPVVLSEIAYVRIRTASDDSLGIFGTMSTEVCYVEDISVAPEPASLMLMAVGGLAVLRRRKR